MNAAAGCTGPGAGRSWAPLAEVEFPLATPCPRADSGDITVALRAEHASAGIARDLAAVTLRAWELDELCDPVTLVASELVTNAVRHGAPPVEGASGSPRWARRWLVFVRLVRGGSGVMCLVSDPSDRAPVRSQPDDLSDSGRGLHVVAGHSHRWGWAPCCGGGKMVWALFANPKPTRIADPAPEYAWNGAGRVSPSP